MFKYLMLFFVLITFLCCSSPESKENKNDTVGSLNSTKKNQQTVDTESLNVEEGVKLFNKEKPLDTLDQKKVGKDFLSICDNLQVSFGGIKSKGYIYPIGSCNSNEQYDMVWVPIGKKYTSKTIDSLTTKFKREKSIKYPSFNIAVFELPKIPQEELEDEFALDLVFPSTVKIYLRVNSLWYFSESIELNNFDEYNEMRLSIIDKIDGNE